MPLHVGASSDARCLVPQPVLRTTVLSEPSFQAWLMWSLFLRPLPSLLPRATFLLLASLSPCGPWPAFCSRSGVLPRQQDPLARSRAAHALCCPL